MELSADLVSQFAKLARDKPNSKSEGTTVYGTVNVIGGNIYVQLDGSDFITPVSMTMDAQHGDRVMVLVKNHTATIIGNLSSPASARTAKSFLQLTEAGLIVGELDDSGNPVGTHSLISPGVYYIVDENGTKLASFSADTIKLGGSTEAKILLCNGAGKITSEDGVLRLIGGNAVGSRSANDGHVAEMVCKTDSANPVALLQAQDSSGKACVLRVEPTGASVNNMPIVAANNIMVAGSVRGTNGKISANSSKEITKTVSVPTGYKLAGIRHISTNYYKRCHITGFSTNPKTNEVSVTLENTGETDVTDLTVKIVWFALLSKELPDPVDEIITW